MVRLASPRPRRSCASSRPPGARELRRRPRRTRARVLRRRAWRRARPRRSRHCSASAAARASSRSRRRASARRASDAAARVDFVDAVGARAARLRLLRRVHLLRDVTVGAAVEGVRGRAVVPRASPGDENEDNKGLAATKTSCAFGAVAPVAARAAGGASSRDVTCVSPASRPARSRRSASSRARRSAAPPSPRARCRARRGRRGFVAAPIPRSGAAAAMRSLSLGAASALSPPRSSSAGACVRSTSECATAPPARRRASPVAARPGRASDVLLLDRRCRASREDPARVRRPFAPPNRYRGVRRAAGTRRGSLCSPPRPARGRVFGWCRVSFSRVDAVPAVARVRQRRPLGAMGDVLHATGVPCTPRARVLDLGRERGRRARGGRRDRVRGHVRGRDRPRAGAVFETPALAASAEARLVDAADAMRARRPRDTTSQPVAPNRRRSQVGGGRGGGFRRDARVPVAAARV